MSNNQIIPMGTNDIIINYTHRQAGHCESGATSNLMHFYGYEMTEPMAFGVGAGLYFSYLPFLKLQYAPMMSFRHFPNTVFRRSMENMQCDFTVIKKFNNQKESMDALDRNLMKGIPTGLQVGVFDLTFFPPEYRMHYNMHNMVVYGKKDGMYLISDTVLEDPQVLTYDDLVRVRWASGAFAPKGKMYWVNQIPKEIDLKRGIRLGMKKSVHEMIKIPFWLIGVKGMRILAKDIRKWPAKHGKEKAIFYLGQVIRMAEDFGTGGAGFRFLFGAFLLESGQKYNHTELIEAGKMMGQAANTFREFTFMGAKICKDRGTPSDTFTMMGDKMMEIAEKEYAVYQKLDKISF